MIITSEKNTREYFYRVLCTRVYIVPHAIEQNINVSYTSNYIVILVHIIVTQYFFKNNF